MITILDYKLITDIIAGQEVEPNTAIVEFNVDEATEIPSDGVLNGYTLYQGSIAYVIGSGKFYVLDSEGNWHDSKDGTILTANVSP